MAAARKKKSVHVRAQDPVPAIVLVVDEDLRVIKLNDAARGYLGPDQAQALVQRSGEAFQCIQRPETGAGCGHGQFCRLCPIREAATLAHKEQRVIRRRTRAEIGLNRHRREVDLLVTATPIPAEGAPRMLLVLEDISALVKLLKPVPVCAGCKRVRNEDSYWDQMEVHFRQHLDLDLSHGLCSECQAQFFGPLRNIQARPPLAR
jgi:hypothetical protein